MKSLKARIFFFLRYKIALYPKIKNIYWSILGVELGKGTFLGKKNKITWPHQVKLGENCRLEHGIYFHYDGIYSKGPSICIGNNVFIGNNTEFNITEKITIGDNCLIAAGCRLIDHNHGTALGLLMNTQQGPKKEIILKDDVWLGCHVVILKGVCIKKGAVVAAGSVVTKDIPENEIWGGVPAKKIGIRK